jgi:hypothetical protein
MLCGTTDATDGAFVHVRALVERVRDALGNPCHQVEERSLLIQWVSARAEVVNAVRITAHVGSRSPVGAKHSGTPSHLSFPHSRATAPCANP